MAAKSRSAEPRTICVGSDSDCRAGGSAASRRLVAVLAAEERLNTNRFKILPADNRTSHRPGDAVGLDSEIIDQVSGNSGEDRVSVAHIAHFRIGKERVRIILVGQRHYFFSMRHINRTQQQRLQHAEDDDVGRDRQRESKDGREGEAGLAAHLAKGESQVLQQTVETRHGLTPGRRCHTVNGQL